MFVVKEEALDGPSLARGNKRSLSGVSPPYAAPLSPKHLRTEAHPSEGTAFVSIVCTTKSNRAPVLYDRLYSFKIPESLLWELNDLWNVSSRSGQQPYVLLVWLICRHPYRRITFLLYGESSALDAHFSSEFCMTFFKELLLNVSCLCVSPAETLPHEENGLIKEQRYMDSASNSMTPRPQTVRSSSEYHSKVSYTYHGGSNASVRRLSSNPIELSSTQPHRRVEGTVPVYWNKGTYTLNVCLTCSMCVLFY